jgi:hypothetical protein
MKLIFSALIVMGLSFAAGSAVAADSRNVSVVNDLEKRQPLQVQRAETALRLRDQDDVVPG